MQVYKFLDKNHDQVRQDVLDLFIQSKNKVGGQEHLSYQHNALMVTLSVIHVTMKQSQ